MYMLKLYLFTVLEYIYLSHLELGNMCSLFQKKLISYFLLINRFGLCAVTYKITITIIFCLIN